MDAKKAKTMVTKVNNVARGLLIQATPAGSHFLTNKTNIPPKYVDGALQKLGIAKDDYQQAKSLYSQEQLAIAKSGAKQAFKAETDIINKDAEVVSKLVKDVTEEKGLIKGLAKSVKDTDWADNIKSGFNRTRALFEGIAKMIIPSAFI